MSLWLTSRLSRIHRQSVHYGWTEDWPGECWTNFLSDSEHKPSDSGRSGKDSANNNDSDRRILARWWGYGIEFMAVLGIFTWAGHWADKRFGHEFPWLMVIGFMVAFVGMLYLLVKESGSLRK